MGLNWFSVIWSSAWGNFGGGWVAFVAAAWGDFGGVGFWGVVAGGISLWVNN